MGRRYCYVCYVESTAAFNDSARREKLAKLIVLGLIWLKVQDHEGVPIDRDAPPPNTMAF